MSILELLQHIVNEPAPRLTPEGRFPREAEAFVDSCLLKDPDERGTPKDLLVSFLALSIYICTGRFVHVFLFTLVPGSVERRVDRIRQSINRRPRSVGQHILIRLCSDCIAPSISPASHFSMTSHPTLPRPAVHCPARPYRPHVVLSFYIFFPLFSSLYFLFFSSICPNCILDESEKVEVFVAHFYWLVFCVRPITH